ncbi:MAG: ABC transporter substrate-binding protein [Caldilineaceae bacterium]|nr:ABC transporter substrate-binding protein [Caldilineaceae bacterium]
MSSHFRSNPASATSTRSELTLPASHAAADPTTRLSRRTLLQRTALAGLVLPLASLVAACVPVAPTQVDPADTAAPSPEGKTVRLITSSGGIPLFAETRGVLAETLKTKNINVEWVGPFAAHAPALQAVTGGTADLTFGGSSTVAMAGILGGSPFVWTAVLSTDPRVTAIVAHPESGIKAVTDLVGKKVAANRSGLGEFILIAALEKYGLTREQVEIVYLNQPDAAPAFAQGQIDAWSVFGSAREVAELEHGGIPIFVEGEELTPEERIDIQSYIALADYVEANPEVIQAVIEAYQAEAEWANTHNEEAVNLIAERAGWSAAIKERYISYNTQYTISFINDEIVADLQRGADWLTAHEVLPEPITIAEHVVRLGA